MIPITIELFSSLEYPYAYLTNNRLRQLWQEFAGKLAIVWRALSLEYINRRSYPKPLLEAEMPLFAHSRDITLRHELLFIAGDLASRGLVDLERFEGDWNNGRYKAGVLAESQRGWHELRVNGSATLVPPGGRQVTNPAVGQIDFDEEHFVLRSFTPCAGDPLRAYRQLLEETLAR